MASFAEIILQAKRPSRSIPVCIRGDLSDRLVDLQNDHDRALDYDEEHNEPPTAPAVLDAIAALESEIEAATVMFVCEALPARGEGSWKELVKAFPPTGDNLEQWRWDMDRFPMAAISASVVEPDMTFAQVEELAVVLSDHQFEKLWAGVLAVNVGDDLIPKSGLVSNGTSNSEAI